MLHIATMQGYTSLQRVVLIAAMIFSASCNVLEKREDYDDKGYLEIQRLVPDSSRPSFDDLPPIMRKYNIPKATAGDAYFSPNAETKTAMEIIGETNKRLIDAKVPGLFEGDIYLGPMKHRGATAKEERRWPDGVIPYVIDPVFDAQSVAKIKNAMEDYHVFTCIRFVERTSQPYYLYITALDGCWSGFGFGNFPGQKLSLGNGCVHHVTILHELMHTVGFFHEQSRRDRDNHVTVYWDNIIFGLDGQFSRIAEKHTTQGTPYDYDSVMHYDRKAFTKNGSPTIVAKNDYNRRLGSVWTFSKWDFVEINNLYNCGYDLNVWKNHQKECITDLNTRRRGADMNDGTKDVVPSIEACCNLCKSKHGCKSFSLLKTAYIGDGGQCWLQSEWISAYTDTSYHSGIIWPWPEDNDDENGDDGDGGQKDCFNKHDHCRFWASVGECEKNSVWMATNCPADCKDECTQNGCADSYEKCAEWAEQGHCEKDTVWMPKNCRKSCKQCGVPVTTVTKKWRDDLRCGSSYPLPDGSPAQCNPNGIYPCCSPGAWCGNTDAHCTTVTKKWRDDLRCGSSYPLPDGSPAQCNPNGSYPCCSPGAWCGNTGAHCTCASCTDYRGK